jgi:two-component system cell cycle response regulator
VDNLKATNDLLGHEAGDRVLTQVAKSIRTAVREYEVVLRYGGDEILCGVLDSDPVAVTQPFESVIAALAASDDAALSYGVVQLEPGEELDDLIARADQAMYDKRNKAGQ